MRLPKRILPTVDPFAKANKIEGTLVFQSTKDPFVSKRQKSFAHKRW
jgi:hypothetical protein